MGLVEDAEVAMDTDGETKGPQKKYYIDTVNLKVARKGMEMKKFLDDCMSKLFVDFSFKNEMVPNDLYFQIYRKLQLKIKKSMIYHFKNITCCLHYPIRISCA